MKTNQVFIVAFNQQRFLNNKWLTHLHPPLRYIILILTGLMWSQAYAADYDQKYSTWKQQHATTPSNTQDHYLSKPTLKAVAAKISINTANLEQLQQLHGVGAKKAQAILDYRQKNGRFKSIDELQNVKGFGAQLLSKNREQLSL